MKDYIKPVIATECIKLEDIILVSTTDNVLDWENNSHVDEEL